MAEENDADGGDLEAEMLRMMQEELGGDDAEGGSADSGEASAPSAGTDVDSLLEEEMLKAMEQETGDSDAGGALSAFMGAPAAPDYGDEAEGIEKLTDVEVEITVELGESLVPIQEIMTWATGSVVELNPEEHDTVKVLLNGSPFATGEIVVVGDTFGVRIVELLDPTEAGPH